MSLQDYITEKFKVIHKVKNIPGTASSPGLYFVHSGNNRKAVYIVSAEKLYKIYDNADYYTKTEVNTRIGNIQNNGIRKIYTSYSAMDADKSNPIGTDGQPILDGQLVIVSNTSDQSQDGNYIYNATSKTWTYAGGQAQAGELAKKADLVKSTGEAVVYTDSSTQRVNENLLPVTIRQNNPGFSRIVSEVTVLDQSTGSFDEIVYVHNTTVLPGQKNNIFAARSGTSYFSNWLNNGIYPGADQYLNTSRTEPQTNKIYVSNGAGYYWNGTELVSVGDAEIDNKVDKAKFDTENLLSGTIWTSGYYITNDTPMPLNSASYSDFVQVSPQVKYYIFTKTVIPILGCVYDKNKNFISNLTHNNAELVLRYDTAYIKINIDTNDINNSKLLSIDDYNKATGNIVLKSEQIDNNNLIQNIYGINKNENILHQELNITPGFYLNSNNEPVSQIHYGYSGYLEVKDDTQYYSNLQIDFLLYDENQIFIKRISSISEQYFTTTSDTKYIRVNLPLNTDLSLIYLYADTTKDYKVNTSLNSLDSSKVFLAKNYFDKNNVVTGGYYNNQGEYIISPNFSYAIIDVEPNTEFIFNKLYGQNNGLIVDRSGLVYPIVGDNASPETYTITTPPKAIQIILNCGISDLAAKFWKRKDEYDAENTSAYIVEKIVTFKHSSPTSFQFNLSMRNDNTFVGAVNTIIDAFYTVNPRVRIAMATHFTKDGRSAGVNGFLENVVDTQLKIAEYWGLPCLNLSDKCGWVKKTMEQKSTNTIKSFFADQLHPATDATGQSSTILKNYFVEFLRPIFGSNWNGKSVGICGTSITAGHGSNEAWAKHIDAAILELGGVSTNYAVSGRCARLKTVDGTPIENSFMNLDDSKNYTVVASAGHDLIILDHGINDQQYDNTDFIEKY